MFGLISSVLTAIFRSFADIISKTNVDNQSYLTLSVFYRITGIPVLLLAVFIFGIPEDIGFKYYLSLSIAGPIVASVTILYMKALELSDISVVAPVKSLSPLLTAVSAYFIVGELPSLTGVLGIVFILCGVYTIKIEGNDGMLEPIKRLITDRGVQITFLIILMYGISAPVDKIGVEASSPLFLRIKLV